MGTDPLADGYPGISPYNYVLNNPLRYIDPTGAYLDDIYFNEDGGTVVVKNNKPNRYFVEQIDAEGNRDYREIDTSNESGLGVLSAVLSTRGEAAEYIVASRSASSDEKRVAFNANIYSAQNTFIKNSLKQGANLFTVASVAAGVGGGLLALRTLTWKNALGASTKFGGIASVLGSASAFVEGDVWGGAIALGGGIVGFGATNYLRNAVNHAGIVRYAIFDQAGKFVRFIDAGDDVYSMLSVYAASRSLFWAVPQLINEVRGEQK